MLRPGGEGRGRGGGAAGHVQLLAGVEGSPVDVPIELRPQVLQAPVVPESAPLDVHTHAPLVPLHPLQVTHLLHVAGVRTRAWGDQSERSTLWTRRT